MDETLKDKTARGLFWGGMNNGVQQLIGLLAGIILGRLLSPDDYGMIAMITIFSVVATELQSSGFKVALTNLKNPTPNDYNSVFWFNIVVSLIIYLILFFTAPLIARYYHTPALVPLCRYTFLGFFISSFALAQSAWLFKNLRTKQQAKAGMTAIVVSNLVGIIMAWRGFAYWALATQTLVYILVNTLMVWHYSPWRPTFSWDPKPVRTMFRFSCKIMVSAILTQVNNNILNILLGRYYSAHQTGQYNQAYQWNYKASYTLQGMVQTVAQPVFVDLQDDRERQLRALRKLMRFAAFVSFPLLLGFSLVAKEFIVLTITEKWLVSAGYLQVLCVAGAFMPLSLILSNLIISRGRSDIYMWSTLALGVCQIALMLALVHQGVSTMVVAFTVLNVVWFFVWHFFARRMTGYGLLSLLKDIVPFLLIAAVTMVVTHFLTAGITVLWVRLLVRIVVAAVIYLGTLKLAHAKILDEALSYLRHKTPPSS
ncbi:MAG: lipopolysaccharide biosynthesis protein [Prevotella sp.]|nr:lipopolysaccharide biosynthesis protein [Prevotella sp.]